MIDIIASIKKSDGKFTEKFVEKIAKIPSLMPSFHLSLQSGCDSVLKRMNRHYTTSEYASAVETLRKYYPMCAVTTDIIVGFPGESDEEFESTINFVEKISFAKIHIFPYSPREGTAAAKMKNQIDGILKAKRCKILETSEKKHRSIFQQKHCGKYVPVLFEQQKDGVWEGYTENYLPVFLKSAQDLTDQIINVKIISQSNDGLLSEI